MGEPVWLDRRKYNLASPVSTFTRRPNAILYPFPTGKVFLEITCACCKLNDFFHFVQLDSVILVVLLNSFFAFGHEPAALEAVSLFIEGKVFLLGI